MISRLIHLIKSDEYTHAAISLDMKLEHMYSFSRKYTFNPFIGMFKKENLNKGVYRACPTLPGAIIEVKVSKQQYEKAKALLNHFTINRDYYKYNYKGLVYGILDKPLCVDNKFLCSEFVYYILKECGVVDLQIARNLVRPQSLLSIEGRIIYQGDLKELKAPSRFPLAPNLLSDTLPV